jgi:hypothetical protein
LREAADDTRAFPGRAGTNFATLLRQCYGGQESCTGQDFKAVRQIIAKEATKISPQRRCLRRRIENILKIKGNSRQVLVLSLD